MQSSGVCYKLRVSISSPMKKHQSGFQESQKNSPISKLVTKAPETFHTHSFCLCSCLTIRGQDAEWSELCPRGQGICLPPAVATGRGLHFSGKMAAVLSKLSRAVTSHIFPNASHPAFPQATPVYTVLPPLSLGLLAAKNTNLLLWFCFFFCFMWLYFQLAPSLPG